MVSRSLSLWRLSRPLTDAHGMFTSVYLTIVVPCYSLVCASLNNLSTIRSSPRFVFDNLLYMSVGPTALSALVRVRPAVVSLQR